MRSTLIHACRPARQCGGSQKPNGAMTAARAKTGSHPQKGDQAGFEPAREGMEPGRCESQPGRGNNVAPALVTLPHYASPVGGPMGCRVSRRRGAHSFSSRAQASLTSIRAGATFPARGDLGRGFYNRPRR
jgi:hypothetical protein